MSNMSYCRFENTVSDLEDCEMALEGLFNSDSSPLSETELEAAARLIESCQRIAELVRGQMAEPINDDQLLTCDHIQEVMNVANEQARCNEDEDEDDDR